MSKIHFDIIEPAFRSSGYNLVVLENDNRDAINTGLRFVNNDACYPSLMVVGQIMDAVLSGKYDMTKTAVLMSQTGGGCRASNYMGFIRRALAKAGYPDVPVISINLASLEKNPGFKFTPALVQKGMYGLVFGDIFLRCLYHVRPYEAEPGSANALHEKWKEKCIAFLSQDKLLSHRTYKKMCREMIRDFDKLPILDIQKPRVGIVGEILVKFAPAANNHLVELLESEGAEAVVPDLLDFFLYCFYNANFKAEKLGMSDKSVSKWERGVCLPDVSVYKELCSILGISLNEFLAGEDIAQENMIQKSETNIIEVIRDNINKQKCLKVMRCILLVISICAVAVIGFIIYRLKKPQNYISPIAKDSIEMQTAELLAGPDGAFIYKFVTTDEYKKLRLHIYQYESGKLSNQDKVEIGFEDIGSPKSGEIVMVPDFGNYVIKLIISGDGSKLSTEIPVLENVEDREYYGRSATEIQNVVDIRYNKQQPLIAFLYDDDTMSVPALDDLINSQTDLLSKNDYVYYVAFEFCK